MPTSPPESPLEERQEERPPLTARIAALVAVAAATGLLLAPVPTGWLGVWHGQILDFGHVPLFAVLVLALRTGMGPPLRWPLLTATAFAGVAELVQPLFGRTCDLMDFLRGSLGALAAAAAIRAWESRHSRLRAVTYLILALVLPVWPIIEVAPYLADTVAGRRAFPVLADFSTDRELLRWECGQAALSRSDEAGCRIEFLPGPEEYPRVMLQPVVRDFADYRWLCYEFRVIGGPLDLVTSIRTGMSNPHQTAHTDVSRRFAEGSHTARLDLAVVAEQGEPEKLDLSDVRTVLFFVIRPQETRTIILTRIWLER